VPLYYELIDGSIGRPLVQIEPVTEDGVTYLQVSVDVRNAPIRSNIWFRIAAAWVYPSPDNWGLERWRMEIPFLTVQDDADGFFRGKGEWHLWFQVNNAGVETVRGLGGRPRHEWTKVFDGDSVTNVAFDGTDPVVAVETGPWSTGSVEGTIDLGPDLLLFPDIPGHNSIRLHVSGYEDDGSLKAQDSLGLINEWIPLFSSGNTRLDHNVSNTCSEGSLFSLNPHTIYHNLENLISSGGCGHYTVFYSAVPLGPVRPDLAEAALEIIDAYSIGDEGPCDPVEPGCSNGDWLAGLPLPLEEASWHPLQEPVSPDATPSSIFETTLFKPQSSEENLAMHLRPERIYELALLGTKTDPDALDATLRKWRAAIDLDLTTIGPEVLLDVYALRAALPKGLWKKHFGDLPAPKPQPDATRRQMTGSAKIRGPQGRTDIQLRLFCDPLRSPQRLVVRWGGDRSFELDLVLESECEEEPTPMHSHSGAGIGRLDGVPGAVATWTFQDLGEPGSEDHVELAIADQEGALLLELDTAIDGANLQAHEDHGQSLHSKKRSASAYPAK